MADGDGSFSIAGEHTYSAAGSYTVSIALSHAADSTNFTTTITVQAAPILVSTPSFSATQAQLFGDLVTSFTQVDPLATDFFAAINWGDGQTSDGMIAGNDDGSFSVYGEHTYAASGDFNCTVSISDTDGNSVSASGMVTVAPGSPPTVQAIQPGDVAAAVGQPFDGTLAAFTDPAGDTNPGDFTAVLSWTNGETAAVTLVSDGNGGFVAKADNAVFTVPGENDWTLTIAKNSDESVYTASGTAFIVPAVLTAVAQSAPLANLTPGQSFSDIVASFHDVDDNGTYPSQSYSTTILWGDGQSSAGTITSDGNDGYTLQGDHGYTSPGIYHVVALVYAPDGYSASASTTVIVAIPLTANAGVAVNAIQNQSVTAALASFSGSSQIAADYMASVDWGDGDVTPGIIAANGTGGFTVQGSHAYTFSGSFFPTVTVTTADGEKAIATDTATVADAPLLVTGSPLSAAANTLFTQSVASFTTAIASPTANQFSAQINWGDNASSTGTIVADPSGGFTVQGTHTYSAAGTYRTTITVTDSNGATAATTTPVNVLAAGIFAKPVDFAGPLELADQAVGAIVSTNPAAVASDFSANIDWNDGSTTTGTIWEDSPGHFTVIGTHTYSSASTYAIAVVITGPGGLTASTTTTATITAIQLTTNDFTLGQNLLFSDTVGSFTALSTLTAGAFSAQVNWGDGSSDAGTIVSNGEGGYDIQGSHTYTTGGNHTLSVTVTDTANDSTTATANVTVQAPTLTVDAAPITLVANQPFSGVVATVSLGEMDADPGNFSATVDWGNGPTTGTIVTNDAGEFDVQATGITFADFTPHAITVTVTGPGGISASVSGTVQAVPLGVTGSDLEVQTNQPFHGILASFQGADTSAGAAGFQAMINWHDGSASQGSIVANSTGGFDVWVSHTYVNAGDYEPAITIIDTHGNIQRTIASVSVDDNFLSVSGVTLTVQQRQNFSGVLATLTGPADAPSAQVDWGDGTSNSGTVVANPAGGFSVQGSHTYANSGAYSAIVTVTDLDGNFASATATVMVQAPVFTVTAVDFTPVTNQSFSGVVATLSLGSTTANPADFTVTVNWDTGGTDETTTGTIVADPAGGYDIQANGITYTDTASHTVTVTVTDTGGNSVSDVTTVQSAILGVSAVNKSIEQNQLFSTTVATFQDSDDTVTADSFVALVGWGDGFTSEGIIVNDPAGGFDIQASHAYASPGTYTTTVALYDAQGNFAYGTGTDVVQSDTLTATGSSFSAVQGRSFSGVLATITDPRVASLGDLSALLTWGGGETSSGTLAANSDGTYRLTASHVFSAPGSYFVGIQLTDAAGQTDLFSDRITVAPVLQASMSNFAAVEGESFTRTLTTFTDATGNGDPTAYAVSIALGNGQTAQGSVQANDDGSFSVQSSLEYDDVGSYALTVAVTNNYTGDQTTTTDRVQVNGQGTTSNWTGAVDSNWFTAGNWSTNAVPTSTTNVVIDLANANITLDTAGNPITVNSLNLAAGTLTLATGTTLNIATLGWSGGAFAGSGSIAISSTLNISGPVSFNGGTMTLRAQASANWTAGTITSAANTRFVNNGQFTAHGGTQWTATLGAVFQNNGTFVQNSAGTLALGLIFDVDGTVGNTGTVQVKQGTLRLDVQGPTTLWMSSASGTYTVDSQATLDFHAGNYDLDTATSIGGTGIVQFSGANVNLGGGYSAGTTNISAGWVTLGTDPNNVGTARTVNGTLSGGNLAGVNTFAISDKFTWSGGTVLNLPGLVAAVDVLNGAVLTLLGSGRSPASMDPNWGYNRELLNHGTIRWIGTGGFDNTGLARIDNIGAFIAQGNGTLFGGILGMFNNWGTFLYQPQDAKSVATITPGLRNFSGAAATVKNGTLHLTGGTATAATITVGRNATLALDAYTIDADSTVQGFGTVQFDGGSGPTGIVTIDGTYTVPNAVISSGTACFNTDVQLTNVQLSGGSLSGTGNTTITNTLTWTGGGMSGPGTTAVTAIATVSIQGASPLSLSLSNGRTLQNEGLIRWSGLGGGSLSSDGTATINNLELGTFEKTDDSTVQVRAVFNNYGTLNIQQGVLQLGGGGDFPLDCTIIIDRSATLDFAGGTVDLQAAIDTAGTVEFGGGDINVAGSFAANTINVTGGDVTFGEDLTISNGLLSNGTLTSGTLTISRELIWAGGTLNAITTVTGVATLVIDDDGDGESQTSSLRMGDGCVLDNEGTIRSFGSSTIAVTQGGTAIINNTGTGTLTVEGEVLTLGVTFNNTGTVSVQQGQLILQGGGISTDGTFQLSNWGLLTFKSDYTVDFPTTISNAPSSTKGIVSCSAATTTINVDLTLYQIVIDGGVAVLNGNITVNQMILSPGGTLSGIGTVTVTQTFNWTGGTMTGGGTTVISLSSVMFVFANDQGGVGSTYAGNSASNRAITNYGQTIWFEAASIFFRGNVTFDNRGEFTALDGTTLETQGANNTFNNRGTFIRKGSGGSGNTFVGVAFNNFGEVRIDSGNLSLVTGTSSSLWRLDANASLTLTGTGSGANAQVYLFDEGSRFVYPNPQGAGSVIVDGRDGGGMRVQGNGLTVNRLLLNNGAISGYGNLIVTGQMLWSGGTMTNAGPSGADTNAIGSITIAARSAGADRTPGLYILPNVVNGQIQIPTLDRPLNLLGNVGWLGGPGSIKLPGAQDSDAFVNTQREIDKNNNNMTNADNQLEIPSTDVSRGNLGGQFGGYGYAVPLARALRAVLVDGQATAALPVDAAWGFSLLDRAVTRDRADPGSFFEGRITYTFQGTTYHIGPPAIVRASLEVAYERLYSRETVAANRSLITYLTNAGSAMRPTLLAFRTGDPRNIGNPSTQFADSTLVARVRMAGGVVSGLAVGITEPVVGVVRFVYRGGEWVFERVTNPIQTLQAIDNGARQAIDAVNRLIADIRDNPLQAAQDMLASLTPLWTFIKNNVNARNTMNLLFPDWVRAYDLNVSSQLVSFDGGYYLGKGISRAAFEILAAAASSGLVNLAARSSTITTIVSCIIDIARVFMARTPGLILGSVRVANTALQVVSLPQTLVVRAQVALIRGLGRTTGHLLGSRLAAPFAGLRQRAPFLQTPSTPAPLFTEPPRYFTSSRFGRGSASWNQNLHNYQMLQRRAERLMRQAAQNIGVRLEDYVDEIRYVPNASAPYYFLRSDGRRIIVLNAASVNHPDRSQAMLNAMHELGHAIVEEQIQLALARMASPTRADYRRLRADLLGRPDVRGPEQLYALEEVFVEALARQSARRLSTGALRDSLGYQEGWAQRFNQLVARTNARRVQAGLPPIPLLPIP